MKNKPTITAQTRKPWKEEVEPILKAIKGTRGFNTVVARKMSELLGRNVKRQQVESWFSKTNRSTPSNDTAIVIVEAARLAREELNL